MIVMQVLIVPHLHASALVPADSKVLMILICSLAVVLLQQDNSPSGSQDLSEGF